MIQQEYFQHIELQKQLSSQHVLLLVALPETPSLFAGQNSIDFLQQLISLLGVVYKRV